MSTINGTSDSTVGKQIRLNRILGQGPTIMVPLDDALISGPTGRFQEMDKLMHDLSSGDCDSILAFSGTLKLIPPRTAVGRVLNVSASSIRSIHTKKVVISNIEQAHRLGADAIAFHVNIGSRYESDMLSSLGMISQAADKEGMPLIAIMYPRTEKDGTDYNFEDLKASNPYEYTALVAHACRIGQELGADVIKTQYTGTPDSFSTVINSCHPIPVIIAGGKLLDPSIALQLAFDAIMAGARGVSFGRNIHQRLNDSGTFLKVLSALIKQKLSVTEAQHLLTTSH